MKKKLLSVLLVGVMAVSIFAGCGGGGAKTDGGSDSSAKTESDGDASADAGAAGGNSLTVYAWDANFNIPALQAAEAAYKEKNPDFTLEIIEQSQSSDVEDAITLAGSSGDYSALPDIVLFQDHYIQKYVSDYPDAFQPLEGADIDWNDFGAEKLSYSTINGQHYGAPVDNGTAIFAYRTDCLEAAGYTIDDVTGITWDEFDEIGKKVYEATGKYLLCMDGDGNDLPYMMLQEEGASQFKDGEPYITENEKMVKIIEVICKLVNDKVLYLANDWSDYTDQAIQGDMVAGVFNGNWIIPTIEQLDENSGKWEITSAPTLTGAEGYASNGGSSLYITGNCQNVDLAKDFLAYTFGGGDGAMATYDDALRNGGVIGTCISASKSDVYQEGIDYFNGQAIYAKIVEMGANVPIVEQNDYHYSCRSQIATAIQNVTQNGATVEDALKEAESNLRFEMGLN